MAAVLHLELVNAANTFEFDVDGAWDLRQDYDHRAFAKTSLAGETAPVKRITEVWDFTGAYLTVGTAASGDAATDATALMAKVTTILNALQEGPSSSDWLERAAVSRVTGGTEERTLTHPAYQGVRLEQIRFGTPELRELAHGAWTCVVQCDLTVAADIVFADDDGLVDLVQTTSETINDAGLKVVEWITDVETAEGVDAAALARTYGKIPKARYGDRYTWVTNDFDGTGVEITVLDDDQRNTSEFSSSYQATSRTPTRVRARSAIQQWGEKVSGSADPGVAPTLVDFRTQTETSRNRRTTTYTAFARGPGAQSWVIGQQGRVKRFTSKVEIVSPTGNEAITTWVNEEILTAFSTIAVTVSGGGKRETWVERPGNLLPAQQLGPFTVWEIAIEVRSERVAATADRRDLPLPPPLPPPWRLVRGGVSREDLFPRRVEPALSAAQQRWERRALHVYRGNEEPNLEQLQRLLLDTSRYVPSVAGVL